MTSGWGGLEGSPATTQPRSSQTFASLVEAPSLSETQRGTTAFKDRQRARGETRVGPGTRSPGCRPVGAGSVRTRTDSRCRRPRPGTPGLDGSGQGVCPSLSRC